MKPHPESVFSSQNPRISAIAALSRNRVIGKNNQLPWDLPEDLAYFKRMTLGKPIISGRKNFEAMGRVLPKRLNIIVTRQPNYSVPGAVVVATLELALQAARAEALRTGMDEIFIIGGGEIYSMALPMTDRLYLTWIDREVEGDVFFPLVPEGQFQEVSRQEHHENGWNYAWCVADRVNER